jgi:formylglycine-generating enzyme required for sulfatase activity
MQARTIIVAAVALFLSTGAVQADVFNMGGTFNPATGTWTGLASLGFVPVGNPGNSGQLSGWNGYGPERTCGAVNYTYAIGKYDVTAGQYCTFLNAVAKTDTYGLYNTNMDTTVCSTGCNIIRTGSSGNYTYTAASDWANRPVNFVSWGDAARFCNWLTNGQPNGLQSASTTEDGAYYLNGAMSNGQLQAVTRKTTAQGYYLPTEDEWYKAAYFDPTLNGATGGYWEFPTRSNTSPNNILANPDQGNSANYFDYYGTGNGTYTIGAPYFRTPVGAFENSASHYGTYDQAGNVWQWNESVVYSSYRGVRGGSFAYYNYYSDSATRYDVDPTNETDNVGFRVSEIPEPATLSLLALGGLATLRQRRK